MTMLSTTVGKDINMLQFIQRKSAPDVPVHFPRNGLGSGGHAVAAAAAWDEDISDAENEQQQHSNYYLLASLYNATP